MDVSEGVLDQMVIGSNHLQPLSPELLFTDNNPQPHYTSLINSVTG